MPKVNEFSLSLKIDLAKGEHLKSSSLQFTFNFRSIKTHSIDQGIVEYV
jgi:hypothetical protein